MDTYCPSSTRVYIDKILGVATAKSRHCSEAFIFPPVLSDIVAWAIRDPSTDLTFLRLGGVFPRFPRRRGRSIGFIPSLDPGRLRETDEYLVDLELRYGEMANAACGEPSRCDVPCCIIPLDE